MLQFLERRVARIAESRLLRAEISDALRARPNLGDGAVIRVAEMGCAAPGCSDTETIVLLMRPSQPSEAVKVAKPMLNLESLDLDDLVAQLTAKRQDLSVAHP